MNEESIGYLEYEAELEYLADLERAEGELASMMTEEYWNK